MYNKSAPHHNHINCSPVSDCVGFMKKCRLYNMKCSPFLDRVRFILKRPHYNRNCSLLSDYVGFIKKCMKQMQDERYKLAKKIDLEIQHLDKGEAPTSPGKLHLFSAFFAAYLPNTYVFATSAARCASVSLLFFSANISRVMYITHFSVLSLLYGQFASLPAT